MSDEIEIPPGMKIKMSSPNGWILYHCHCLSCGKELQRAYHNTSKPCPRCKSDDIQGGKTIFVKDDTKGAEHVE